MAELKDVDKELDERLFELKDLYDKVKEMERALNIQRETKKALAEYANNLRKVAATRRIIEGLEEIPEQEEKLLKERWYGIVVDEKKGVEL